MRVPLSWLREYCATSLSAEEVAEALTTHGIEVDRVLRPWEDLAGVTVARVLEVRDHPGADRLCVAAIDDGSGHHEVVVGVRNMVPGDLVPYAPPGARLPGLEGPLERREIRGIASEGMLCSPKELDIGPDHTRILVLADETAPGQDLKEHLGLDDAVVDVEVAPNRPDLLSVAGVAREVAAVTGEDLALPDTSAPESIERAAATATVAVEDPQRCPRYLARVILGVTVGPSPLAAQVRLTAAGMRPVSNVVDATNYVMLEMGQPLHPFDLQTLAGPGIVVRRAREGQRLVTLDGEERHLTSEDLMIADLERDVAIAGVMGGGDTEVSAGTADVLLESAHFEPIGIARTARRLGLRTEASVRFERGVDPGGVGTAAARAAALIASWAGGRVLAGAADVGSEPEPRSLALRPARTRMLLGLDVSSVEVREALGRLRLPATEEDDEVIVEVPSYRVDLTREADLIEEVGRIVGYDRLPSTLPGVKQAGGLTREQRIRRRVRDVLAGAGLWETQSFTFVPASDLELFEDERRNGIRVANPISEEQAFLRTSLLPGLLRAARRNVAHRRLSVRLFEVGTTFLARDGEPEEGEHLAAVFTGPEAEEWPGSRRALEYFDAAGVLQHLLESLGVGAWAFSQFTFAPFHPGRSTEVVVSGEPPLGEVAELHPAVAEAFDLPGRVAVFEVRLGPLVAAASGDVAYREVSRFPPVHRDLAFVVDGRVPAGDVREALAEAAGELLDRAVLFDVFEGGPLPPGKRNLAFSVDFRAPDRTLTDEEVDRRVRVIDEHLASRFGAQLRTG